MVNLEWFRTFKAVFEKGSMTAAAESLNMSQPGVSHHLGSLEAYVGSSLFDRQPRVLVPTDRARILYNTVSGPLGRLETAEKEFQKRTDEDRPTVCLGMCFETFRETLEPELPNLRFNVILEFGEYGELLKKLDKGILDLAVTPRKMDLEGAEFRPFSEERIFLVGGKGTDAEELKKIIDEGDRDALQARLKEETWYAVSGENEHLNRFWMRNFQTPPEFRPNYLVPHFQSILRSLENAPGLAVVPNFLCEDLIAEGRISLIWEGDTPLTNTLYFGRQKRETSPQQITAVERIIEAKMPQSGGFR